LYHLQASYTEHDKYGCKHGRCQCITNVSFPAAEPDPDETYDLEKPFASCEGNTKLICLIGLGSVFLLIGIILVVRAITLGDKYYDYVFIGSRIPVVSTRFW